MGAKGTTVWNHVIPKAPTCAAAVSQQGATPISDIFLERRQTHAAGISV